MKRIINIGIIIFTFIFVYLVIYYNDSIDCIFKKITGIACPACGLTRSFRCILHFDLVGSLYYNILGIPLFIIMVISFTYLIIDIVNNSDKVIMLYKNIFSKYDKVIIVILILVMIINNIHGI